MHLSSSVFRVPYEPRNTNVLIFFTRSSLPPMWWKS